MALYLGDNKKLKVISNGVTYCFRILTTAPVIKGIKLLSSEGYVLRDKNGMYLTVKDGE